MTNIPLTTAQIDKSKSFTTINSQPPNPLLLEKIAEAKGIEKGIEELEKAMITPILRNPMLIPMVPIFDARVNYYLETINWQNFYQMESNASQNLEQLIRKLQESIVEIEAQLLKCKNSSKKYMHKKNRRMAVQIDRCFKCPYENCFKSYGSDVSLNLHIKIKHGGGNKTQRQKLALQICEAQNDGLGLPSSDIKFPPGYIEQYKKRFVGKMKLCNL